MDDDTPYWIAPLADVMALAELGCRDASPDAHGRWVMLSSSLLHQPTNAMKPSTVARVSTRILARS